MNFPYLKSIKVIDCHTYQNIDIDAESLSAPFKHIIVTGKNGSGKSTILLGIAKTLDNYKVNEQSTNDRIDYLTRVIGANKNYPSRIEWEVEIQQLSSVKLNFNGCGEVEPFEAYTDPECLLSYFQAQRHVNLNNVDTVTKEAAFVERLKKSQITEEFSKEFKQYLVNKKVFQAFAKMDNENTETDNNAIFFEKFEACLKQVFKDDHMKLIFLKEQFEFVLQLEDGRKLTFNQLPAGFSAFLSILIDLMMRIDLIRKEKNNFNFDPSGIVIIDEPETHLHLEMQYEILPILTSFFPNIQFVVASHSPAVISSIKNVMIFDLTSKQTGSKDMVSSSFVEIMTTHLGLDNQFSNVADEILKNIDDAFKAKDTFTLKQLLIDNEQYLSISLRLEIESRINHLKSLTEEE